MTRRANQQGFTLIELLLSLAFIAFVLLFAISSIIQVMRTYNKGLAIKQINQTARSALADMTDIVQTTSPSAIITSAQPSGRLCFGGVSYVWNVAGANTNQYTDGSAVGMARVNDAAGAMCQNSSGSYPKVDPAQATELLSPQVWVQSIVVSPNGDQLVGIKMQFSTADDPANPALQSDPQQSVTCKGGSDGQFCAVVTFNTTVMTRGS